MKQENRKQEDKKQFLFGAVYIIEQDYTQAVSYTHLDPA